MQAAQTPANKLRFVTPDKKSNMNMLWQDEEFDQICSRESRTGKAAEIEKTISVKEHERDRYDSDPTIFYENRFWNRSPDDGDEQESSNTIHPGVQTVIRQKRRFSEGKGRLRLTRNTKASSKRLKRLPRNGRLNRLILWQGGVVQ